MSSSTPTPASLPRNVKLLGWASLLNDIASEIIFPLMPQFLFMLGGNKFHLGIIEGVADSTASLLKLATGAWSDRLTRRKPLVAVGYVLASAIRPLTGVISAPWQLFAVRTTDRIGKGIRTSPRDAMIADSTAPSVRGRAFGFHRAMDHLGAAIGPALATTFLLIWPGHLRTLFLLTLIPGVVVCLLIVFGLKEIPREQSAASEHSASERRWFAHFSRDFRLFMLALVIFTLGNSSDAFLLVRAGSLGVPQALLPILWLVFHLAKSAGNLAIGRLVDRVGPRRPLYAGWLLYMAVYLAFAFATEAWHAWALFVAYAVFYSLTEPAEKTLVANLAGREQKGLAFGWFHFAIGVAALPSSLIFGALYEEFGAVAAFGWGASLAFAACVVLAFVRGGDLQTAA